MEWDTISRQTLHLLYSCPHDDNKLMLWPRGPTVGRHTVDVVLLNSGFDSRRGRWYRYSDAYT